MLTTRRPTFVEPWVQAVYRGLASSWHLLHLGALLLVVALSPSTYPRGNRTTISRHIYSSTVGALPWFTAMTALISLVLIRVVVVTAQSYGLSQFALEMVVRVLVLELIPLSAAMFIALRSNLIVDNALNTRISTKQPSSRSGLMVIAPTLTELQCAWVPRVLASSFSVMALATVSSLIALVLAYLSVHGLSPWGLPGYTRTVGHVFDLAVTLGFGLKTLFFSLAVAIVPLAASLEVHDRVTTSTLQPGIVRLFLVLLCIEATSLSVKYI
jgi:phospholipid/cholesterol/gamma-HCH transport system permease protein